MRNLFSITDQIFFAQRLSLLIDSDISLTESLGILKSMDNSKKHKKIFDRMIADCEQGVSLSKSMLRTNVRFDPLLITLIKNGEYSGSLSLSLFQVSKNLEKRNELRKKIIGTLIYPSFIFIATICMTLFLVLFIFPKILPLLSSLNIQLPLLTRIVKSIYEYTVSYGLQTIGIGIILLFLSVFLFNKFSGIKKKVHAILLKIPFLGLYIRLHILASVCSIGEMLLSSGRSLSEFHIFSRDSSSNLVFKNAFENIYIKSVQGISFSNSIKPYPHLFSQIMINMCEIGEKTGNLAVMLGHCSRIFDQDIDIFLKRFSSLIEPVLMIFMGLIVGSIALSIILPVYEITNHLTK